MKRELKKLYDSEINVRIDSFWDGGWRIMLGDEMNGYKNTRWDYCEMDEIVPALRELAREFYPESKYVWSLQPWYKKIFNPWKPIEITSH